MKKIIKIKLKSYDYILLDKTIKIIIKSIDYTGVKIKGPIHLPTKRKVFTVLKSPHVHKKSREQFELCYHIRYLEILKANSITVNELMKLEIASGVDVKFKII
ncbi:30S ribosomal protein S10 [Candidatus Shikimatogenerans bostrichidophilus]|uniref:30S ribosomal protein S10 n=1 Tax=Candidatus Shikimatogenerans bostrichidophilus TaxID=2943807 RepID=UPI002966B643